MKAASEQHGRSSAQKRVAPEHGGGRQRLSAFELAGRRLWLAVALVNPKVTEYEKSCHLFKGEFSGGFLYN